MNIFLLFESCEMSINDYLQSSKLLQYSNFKSKTVLISEICSGADVGVLLKSRIKWTESSKIHKSVNPDLTATYNDPWTNNYLSCFLSSNYDTNWIVYGIDGWSHLHYVNLLNSDSQLYGNHNINTCNFRKSLKLNTCNKQKRCYIADVRFS